MLSDFKKHSELRVVIVAAIAFFLLVLGFSLHRYAVFYADSDHGIFSQVFWNGVHGRFFQSSLSGTYSVSVAQDGDVAAVYYHRLAQHFTPALLLWLPLYAIFPSPITLIVLKVALIASAGLVLYGLSRCYLSPPISAMIALSFYGANTVIGPALVEFYDFAQMPLFVFGLLLAMEKRWWWLFGLLAVLTLLVRQDAGLVVFGVGVYMLLSQRFPRIGLGLCALSGGYMLLVTTTIMPMFTDEVSRRFMVEEFGHFTDEQQASTVDVLWAIVRRPWIVLRELFFPLSKTIKYVLGHLLPLAFVPAISPPAWMISAFPLLENLLRREDGPLSINIRYTTPVVPGLFYGAILWWSHHSDRFKLLRVRRIWALCICLSLLFTFTSNPGRAWSFLLPDSIRPLVYVPITSQWSHAEQVRSLLSQVPPDASISASRYIVAHVPNRRAVLLFPQLRFRNDNRNVEGVNYVMVDFWFSTQYQKAFQESRNALRSQVAVVDRIVGDGRYGILDFREGVILLGKRTESNPVASSNWQMFRQQLEPLLGKGRGQRAEGRG